MASAKEVTEAIQISDKIEDYMNMFNQYDLLPTKRYYYGVCIVRMPK